MRLFHVLAAAVLITDMAPHGKAAPTEICQAAPWDLPVEATAAPPAKAPAPTAK